MLAWVGFNQFLLSLILYLRSNISGLLLFKTDSLISVLDRTLMIVICGFLLWSNYFGGRFTIEWFVYAQTAAYAATALIAFFAVIRKSGTLKLNWNTVFFIMILKKSMPFALLVLLMSFYNRIDPVLIERLLPDKIGEIQSGIYAQAFRLLDAGQNFAYLFAVLLLPLFAKMLKENESVQKLTQLSFSIIISGSLIIAIASSFYSVELMQLMYTPFASESQLDFATRINESADIFSLLMFSFVAISSNYIFGTLLTANNSLKYLNIIAFIGLITNVSLNFILIPEMYAYGSAIASLSAQGFTAILYLFFAIKLVGLKVERRIIIGLFGTIILLVGSGFLLKSVDISNWIVSFGILLITGLVVAFIFRLLNIKEFISILKT